MITRLTLVNFKAFRRLDLAMGPLTLLTGLNSSGKSSVLQSLALLRQSFGRGRSASPEEGLMLNGELVELGTARDLLHDDFGPADDLLATDAPLVGFVVVEADVTGGFVADCELDEPEELAGGFIARYDLDEPDEDVMEAYDFPRGASILEIPFQYLHADRITPAVTYPRTRQIALGRGFLGVRGEHTVNYLRHHAEREVLNGPLRHPAATSPQLLDQTVAWMQELCPGVNLQASAIEGTDFVRLSYGFGGTAGINATRRRRPTNVGFGLTYALPIVVACLTATPESLILLENPEAHLHPKGQSRMAALISAAAATGAQLIVETHSDHVLNGVRIAVKQEALRPEDAVIHFFRGNGSGAEVVTPRIDEDGMLAQWPEGFFDEWENSLDQLLD
ncbi:AAA family ATPase [Streptomyces microflavus]|uniref:AAA family ATPase n=1 Tax=Streptomyces microflavus TaxID=1919 RepID=UPI0036AB7C65